MTNDELAEIDAWIEDVHIGSDGFYIESRLVVALRDEVERLREIVRAVAAVSYVPIPGASGDEGFREICGGCLRVFTVDTRTGFYTEDSQHREDCPVAKARETLGEEDA